jgi:hypothetical protein
VSWGNVLRIKTARPPLLDNGGLAVKQNRAALYVLPCSLDKEKLTKELHLLATDIAE